MAISRFMPVLLAAMVLVVFALPNAAHAVATLEVTVSDGTNVRKGETLTLVYPDGTQVEEEDDDDDGIIFWGDLDRGTYVVKSGDTVLRRVEVDRDGMIATTVVMMGGHHSTGFDGLHFGFGPTLTAKWGSFDSGFRQINPGTGALVSSGEDEVQPSGMGFGLEGEVWLPRDFIAVPVFFTASVTFYNELDERSTPFDIHPAGGTLPIEPADTFLNIEEELVLRFLAGVEIFRVQQFSFDLMAGLQLTRTEMSLTTDETGGGGTLNFFKTNDWNVAPAVGMRMRVPLFNNEGVYLKSGLLFTFMDDESLSASSANFDYTADYEGNLQVEVTFGVAWRFGL